MFDSRVAKNGHSLEHRLQGGDALASRRAPSAIQSPMAEPKPYQPGSSRRHWPHEKPQGIARRSSMRRVDLREAGREPRLSSAISAIGVAAKK